MAGRHFLLIQSSFVFLTNVSESPILLLMSALAPVAELVTPELLNPPFELDELEPKLDELELKLGELEPKLDDDVDGVEKLDDEELGLTGSKSSGFNLGIVPSFLPYTYLAQFG